MIDCTTLDEDLERTQDLPVLSPDVLLAEALKRERAARMEIVEIRRENAEQARELAKLRVTYRKSSFGTDGFSAADTTRPLATEDELFEICGALKSALASVLDESELRGFPLSCGHAASRTLEDACDRLERVLSAPGFCAISASKQAQITEAPRAATPVSLSPPRNLDNVLTLNPRSRFAQVSRLKVDWS